MVLPGAVWLALLQVDARRHVEDVVVPVEDVVLEVACSNFVVDVGEMLIAGVPCRHGSVLYHIHLLNVPIPTIL